MTRCKSLLSPPETCLGRPFLPLQLPLSLPPTPNTTRPTLHLLRLLPQPQTTTMTTTTKTFLIAMNSERAQCSTHNSRHRAASPGLFFGTRYCGSIWASFILHSSFTSSISPLCLPYTPSGHSGPAWSVSFYQPSPGTVLFNRSWFVDELSHTSSQSTS